jgi:origin recognition complex subunit 2
MGADRSARRKSARALIEQVVRGDGSDDEVDEDGLAREIYESSEDEHRDDITEATEADATSVVDSAPEIAAVEGTPSKTRRKRKARSPTPPRELPPHELYFAQNKPGRPKTSGNTLASLSLLTHDEYFALLGDLSDRHAGDVEFLERLHAESFPQWSFELAQGFSICLYGYGSKRAVLQKLARHLHARPPSRGGKHRIVIVNGYTATTTMREILTTLAVAIDPAHRIPVTLPATMVPNILSHLGASDTTLTIVVNSIDALPMRKPGYQAVLAQLAAHPQVQLACSADTPDFPLLWDIGIRSAFNFAFHDCTTFAPFAVELDIVDDVHELLGRKSQRVNGREGVAFVLRSLPENAKNLFQLIIGEVLIASEEEGAGAEDSGVEYRMVYNKAVEEFICSSEMAFRTLLKEFVPICCPCRCAISNTVIGFMIIKSLRVAKMPLAQSS